MSVIIFLYIFKLCIFLTVILPLNKRCGWFQKLKNKMYHQLFFEEILMIFIEGYMELLLAGILIEKVPE